MEDNKLPNKREEERNGSNVGESSRSTQTSDASMDETSLKEAKDPFDIGDISMEEMLMQELLLSEYSFGSSNEQNKQSQDLVKPEDDSKTVECAHSLEQNVKPPSGDNVDGQKKNTTDLVPLDENSEYALKFKASLGLGKKVTKEAPDGLYKATKRIEEEPLEVYEEKRRKMSEETTDTQVPEENTGITSQNLQSALDNIPTGLENKELDEQHELGDTKKTDSDEK